MSANLMIEKPDGSSAPSNSTMAEGTVGIAVGVSVDVAGGITVTVEEASVGISEGVATRVDVEFGWQAAIVITNKMTERRHKTKFTRIGLILILQTDLSPLCGRRLRD